MYKTTIQENASSFVTKMQLQKLKSKAMRAGVWFKALRRIDRALIDLTIKVAQFNVRSISLIEKIFTIMEKLEVLLEGSLSRVVREVGFPLARKLSTLAQKWGNLSAKEWEYDSAFASFLAVLNINETGTFNLHFSLR